MAVFGRIGVLYALGDYLEMMSMSSMDGAAYQARTEFQSDRRNLV